jgi:GT2 family glycosyltransferase
VIPTYNSKATVSDTLESVAAQGKSVRHVAGVYVADDCSSDGTVATLRPAWTLTTPLEIIEGDRNLGERGNVNRAVCRFRQVADWMLIIHSDDVAKSNWLESMLERIWRSEARVGSICASWDNWMPDGTVLLGEDDPQRAVEVIRGDAASIRSTLERGCWWHISGCAIRLEAFDDVGGFDPRLAQLGDWDWLLRCLARGWSVEYIPRTLIKYRLHEASVSSRSFREDRDIRESLEIIGRYTALLGAGRLVQLHGRRMGSCARRLVRALLRRDLPRAGRVVETWWLVMMSLARTVAFGGAHGKHGDEVRV